VKLSEALEEWRIRKMRKIKNEEESRIKDLVEKLEKGEITPKEGLKELQKRKLVEDERWEFIPWVVYFILWLPLNFMFADQLPAILLPAIVIYISIVIVVLGIFLAVWATHYHYKIGGLRDDETIILFKEGPYRVMRHPATLSMLVPILLPIILSAYVPFSPLSVAAIIVMIVYVYYGCLLEEKKLDIPKWGDEYLQYMKEVPRFNLILGMCRQVRRKKGGG
jgi:protein-S-isoprenylcysteine O-methyltransferase Ste14